MNSSKDPDDEIKTMVSSKSSSDASMPHTQSKTDSYNALLTDQDNENSKEDAIRAVVRTLEFDKSSLFAQFFLTWINPLVSLGKRYNLTYDDVPKAPASSLVDNTLPQLQSHWIGNVEDTQKMTYELELTAQFKSNTSPSLSTQNRLGSFAEFLLQTETPEEFPFIPQSPTQQKPLPNGTPGLVLDEHTNQLSIPSETLQTHPVSKAISRPDAVLLSDPEPKHPILSFFSAFKWPLIWSAFGEVGYYACAISQPFCVKKLARFFKYYSEGDVANSHLTSGIGWALLLGLVTFLLAIATLFKHNAQIHFSTQASTATLSALFQKTLKIAPYSIANDEKLSSGALTNLMSADSMQIYNTAVYFHFCWSGPITIMIVIYLMYKELGNSAFATLFLMLLMIPYQLGIAEVQRHYRKKLLALTDERLKFTSQLLSGLRVVKVYAWEKVLADKLDEFRQRELAILKSGAQWAWFGESVIFVYPLIVSYVTFMFYVKWNANQFNTETVFLILAYLNTLRLPISFIAQSVQALISQYVSSQRIGHYLAKEEAPVTTAQFKGSIEASLANGASPQQLQMNPSFPTNINNNHNSINNNNTNDDILCQLNNVDLYWSSLDQKPLQVPVLTNLSLTLHRGEVIGLISSSGLGKTALLSGILGNLYPQQARQHVGLKSIPNPVQTSPSTQSPLHQQGNHNEVAQSTSDSEGYFAPGTTTPLHSINTTSSSSYSTTDYMFSWSNTINLVPESLINLKGRCGYSQQHPWLMNDTVRNNITLGLPFDPEWFQVVIDASSLRPDLEILIDADLTIVSDSGVSLSGGQAARVAFARCLYLVDYVDVVLLDDIFSAVDVYVAKNMFYNGVIGILKAKGKGVILSMNSHYDFLQSCDKTLIIDTLTEPNDDVLYWSTLYQKLNAPYEERLGQLAIEQTQREFEERKSWKPKALYNRMTGKYKKQSDNVQETPGPGLLDKIFKKKSNNSSNNSDDYNNDSNTNDSNANAVYAKFEDNEDGSRRGNNNNNTNGNELQKFPNSSSSDSLPHDDDDLAISQSNTISGFRPPCGIVFCGTFDQLLQFDHPLVNSVTFSSPDGLATQKAQVVFDPLALHQELLQSQNLDVEFQSTQQHKMNPNLKQTKAIGQVDIAKEAAQAERLKQKVDGATVKPKNGEVVEKKKESKTPSQAQLSNGLFLFYLQGSRGKFGLWLLIVLLLIISLASQTVRTYTDLLLVKWAEDASKQPPTHSTGYWLQIIGLGMLFSFILYLAQVILFVWAAIDASRYIHKESVRYIFHSAISYLDQTPIGTLLNYMSKDTEVLDVQLPDNLLYVIQQFFRLGSTFIMATIASPLLFIPLIPVLVIIWYLRMGFHNTSVQLKRIESATLQPIYSLFAGVLKGGPTIRALQLQDKFNTRFQLLVDKYIRIKIIATQLERRFGAYLNCITAVYICLLAVFAVLLRAHLNPNLAMLAITSALSLGSLQVTIRFWTLVTQALTSIHRLEGLKRIPLEPEFYTSEAIKDAVAQKQPMEFRQYQLQQEKEAKLTKKSKKSIKKTKDGQLINLDYRIQQQHALSFWPWYGAISFKKLSLRYRADLPLVINSLSINILPGQSVAVLGKTGAGKSTVFGALARLLQPCSGGIEIDGVDIEELGIGDLRSRISIIPQSPTLFSGTIRSNLDPLTRFTDNELWHSLKLVSMDERVRMLENGLYSVVQEMGSNFASSERQLFCIARALLSQPNVAADAKSLLPTSPNSTPPPSPKAHESWDVSSDLNQIENHSQEYTSFSIPPNGQETTTQYIPPPPQASILLCDEITSSTDINADNVIQHTIRTAFSNSTLLVIAHRLSTIIDLDRVLVLRSLTEEDIKNNTNSLLEFDVPFILLNNINSAFYNMCLGLGYDNFIILYQKAKEAFFATQKKEFNRWGTTLKYPEVEVINLPQFADQFTQRLNQQSPSIVDNNNSNDDDSFPTTTTTTFEQQQQRQPEQPTQNLFTDLGDGTNNNIGEDKKDYLEFSTPQQQQQPQLDLFSFTYDEAAELFEQSLKSPDALAGNRGNPANGWNHHDTPLFDKDDDQELP